MGGGGERRKTKEKEEPTRFGTVVSLHNVEILYILFFARILLLINTSYIKIYIYIYIERKLSE